MERARERKAEESPVFKTKTVRFHVRRGLPASLGECKGVGSEAVKCEKSDVLGQPAPH